MATKNKQTKPLPERLVTRFFVGYDETNKILYELALQSRMKIEKMTYRQEIVKIFYPEIFPPVCALLDSKALCTVTNIKINHFTIGNVLSLSQKTFKIPFSSSAA